MKWITMHRTQRHLSRNVRRQQGFTLVELVMTILLIGVLSAVAIPNFIDFRKDAKNAAAQGALGALRSAINVAVVAVKLREDPTNLPPRYPTALEMQANRFDGSHRVLSGTYLMDPASGIPKNPWSISTYSASFHNTIIDCNALTRPTLNSNSGYSLRGWCYRETSGEVWANSNNNTGAATKTENYY